MEDIDKLNVAEIIKQYRPGNDIEISLSRWGEELWKKVTLGEDKSMKTVWKTNADTQAVKRRTEWLNKK